MIDLVWLIQKVMIKFRWFIDAYIVDGCISVVIDLSFNIVDGSSMKIGWNVAFKLWCCVPRVSSLKIYEMRSLEEERRL